jgi:hypothetical protein
MSEYRLRVPAGSSLAAVLAEMPPPVKIMVRDGFSSIAHMSEGQWSLVIAASLECLAVPAESDAVEKRLARELDLGDDAAKQTLSAATFLAWIVSSRKEPTEAIISQITESITLKSDDAEKLGKFADLLASQRPRIRQALERTRLGSSVLPSLIEFGVTVDVRLGFEKQPEDAALEASARDDVTIAVPVAVIHIDTDATTQEVWFQLTKKELEGVIENLQLALRRLRAAEAWSDKK